jgi:hypothetical protein
MMKTTNSNSIPREHDEGTWRLAEEGKRAFSAAKLWVFVVVVVCVVLVG